MNVKPYERDLMVYANFRLHKQLQLYVPPVLLILGSVGNVLSLVILVRPDMRKYSAYVYLAVLSAADTLVLYIGLMRLWLGEVTGRDMRDATDWTCKLVNLVGYTVSDYSGWLIIAVTLERYVAVCHPLAMSSFGMTQRAKTVMTLAGLFAVLTAVNAHSLWTVRLYEAEYGNDTFYVCAGAENYTTLINDVWPWVDAAIYSFVPFLVILVLNTLIICQVIRSRRERVRLQIRTSVLRNSPETGVRRTCAENSRITIMLLTVSFVFLVLTMPVNMTMVAAKLHPGSKNDTNVQVDFRLIQTMAELLMYTNHSVNFLLYCAIGQKFRQNLYRLFSRCRRSNGGVNVDSNMYPLMQANSWRKDTTAVTDSLGVNSTNRISLRSKRM